MIGKQFIHQKLDLFILDSDWEATHQKFAALRDDRLDYKEDYWSQEAKLCVKTEENFEKERKPAVLNQETDLDEEEVPSISFINLPEMLFLIFIAVLVLKFVFFVS